MSNYCACAWRLGAPVPAVNQIQVHVGTGSDPRASYYCEQGIAVQAYSPWHGAVVSDPLREKVGAAANSAAQVGRGVAARRRSSSSVEGIPRRP